MEGKALTWDQLGTEVGGDVYALTMHRVMSDALVYGKDLACMNGWLSDHAKAHRQEEDWRCVLYASLMKYILAVGPRDSYGLSGAQVHVIVTIIFSINHLLQVKKKLGNANIVGLLWATTSSRTLSSKMYQAIRTANSPTKSTLILFSSRLLSPG